MTEMPNIMWLAEIKKEDIPYVGGKGASLGEMTSVGLPVPKAFVVTAQAFRRFLIETGIEDTVFDRLKDLDVDDADTLEAAAQDAINTVLSVDIPEYLKKEVNFSYDKMGDDLVVAVRSSATAEDLPDASFAGQQETYLNIKGKTALLEAIRKCWASLYGARAIYYRAKQGFDDRSVDIAVIVQELVYSEKAGVMFSSHPVTGEPTTIIEGSWGLGEAVVSGAVSPDNYVYDQRSGRIIDRHIANKNLEILPDGEHGTKELEVPENRQNIPVLSDEEIAKLAKFGKISEKHYEIPQDLEWSIVGDEIYILQSRPITTIQNIEIKDAGKMEGEGKIILEGQGASPGVASGSVVIVRTIKDLGKVQDGDILVAKMTNPDMVPAMRKVSAIITDEGGMTCHAAIISRELGTPAVVGTKKATLELKPGQMVSVDGEKGLVYEGAVKKPEQETATVTGPVAASVITATSIKVNVSLPEAAKRAAATGADGVGLLKPVWVRTLDAPTDEFRNMQGGENEPVEHNPMMGWRGIRRDLQSPDQYRLQVEAFKRLWDQGYDNLGIMFPLVSHPDEFILAKEMMSDLGVDVDNVTLGIMVEVPSSALIIEDFIDAGINFASFGTNDLIQYTLAVDRNNQNVAEMYMPQHPAVLKLIEYAIGCCRKAGVECSICGQAGSDPSMVKWLVETGITSVSANIDAVSKIRETAARTEQRIILDAARK